MNEELQKQLAALFASLLDFSKTATTYAMNQIPPLIQEKLAFGRVWETWCVVACVIITGICIWAALSFQKKLGEYKGYNPECLFAGGIISWIFAVGFLVASLCNLYDCLLVWFAPRLYIVEWVSTIINKKS